MYLIIGLKDERMKKFLLNKKFDESVKIIDKMCSVKTIKENVKIIVPFGFVLDNGLISNTLVNFYELLLSLNVESVVYYNSYLEDRYLKICNEFGVFVKKG